MAQGRTVQSDVSAAVLRIHLNRPQLLNAVNAELVQDLLAALEQAKHREVRAVLLAGRGRAFCAGHDLKEDLGGETREDATRRLDRLQDVTRAIRSLEVPVVAAVHGHAIGAGAEFAFACDLVVAAEGTRFRLPEVSLGLSVTNGATRLLSTLVGPMRAKELVMLGEPMEADEAHRIGLVNSVVPAGDLAEKTHSWTERLASQPSAALALAKRALNEGLDGDVAAALHRETEHALRTAGLGDRG